MFGIHQLEEVAYVPGEHEVLSYSIFSEKEYHDVLMLKNKNSINDKYNLLLERILKILGDREKWVNFLLPKTEESIAICHNDLNNLNIMNTAKEAFLIDYDYVGFNFIAYDIANLINETSFDYTPKTYPGFKILKTYEAEHIDEMVKHYPGYYPELGDEVLRFMCVSNLYWAIWSLKRFEFNVSEIFGILEHGLKRMDLFDQYNKLIEKKEAL